MTSALEGVRVLDLSRLLPGPFATQLLADFGADVIKVEEPGRGDYLRDFVPTVQGESSFFLNLNRNKRSVALDLKSEEGRQAFLALSATADVVVESFRPGVMERLGIGYATLRDQDPRLILCSLTGYGGHGPYAQRAGHDVNYLALSGLLATVRDGEGRPVIPGTQIADIGGGAQHACLGILLALLARERTGRGQQVDAAMVDGLASWLVYRWSYHIAGSAEETYLSGEYPCYAVYEAGDGKFLAVGALEAKFWERLCRALGHPEWGPLQFARGVERDRLFDEMRAAFRARTRDEWAQALAAEDCCVTPVLELDELEADPHWQERGLVQRMHDPLRGELRVLGPSCVLSDTPAALRRPPPRLGEHTDEVLGEAGYSSGRCQELRVKGVIA